MKKKSKIIWKIVCCCVVFFLMNRTHCYAMEQEQTVKNMEENEVSDTIDDINYDEIQEVIDDVIGQKNKFNFKDYVGQLCSGKTDFTVDGIFNQVKDSILNEINSNKKILLQLLIVTIIAAVFTNFSNVFQSNQVSETGFYITYLLMFSILTSTFYMATNIAQFVLNALLNFMKVLLPTYMLSIAFSAGAKTSMFYYETSLAVITVADFVLIRVVLPIINIYFMLELANNMMKEDMLSKLSELLELIVHWILRTLIATVVGINTIQGLIVPMAQQVKNSLIIKGTRIIPGVGGAVNTIAETILGAGVLVKNAIGVVGLIVILIICAIPIIKLVVFSLIYKFGAAIVQPISDKRLLSCMNASSNAARLLLSSVTIAVMLFMISIAIIAASTNLNAR